MFTTSKRAAFFVSTVCLTLLFPPVATMAQDAIPEIAQAKSLIAEKQFDKLQPLVAGLEKAAQAGNVDAQFLLGDMFASKDTNIFQGRQAEAVSYYEKALSGGRTGAAIRLGDLYSNDRVVAADPVKAFQYYSQAASTGKSAYAERRVATAYLRGNGVAADPEKAVAMLVKLADAGDLPAARALGDTYADKKFTGADNKLAIKYYEQAFKAGDHALARKLGSLLSAEKDPESLAQSVGYFKQAADAGDSYSKLQTAKAHLAGSGVPRDPAMGVKMLEELVAANDRSAYSQLGSLYASGEIVKQDGKKAAELYGQAVQAGDAGAIVRLADIYYYGRGIPKDPNKAISLLTEASDNGNVSASRRLMTLYREAPRKAITKSPAKAKAIFEKVRPSMTPEGVLQEEILFAAMDSTSVGAYQQVSEQFEKLPMKLAKPTFSVVRRLNENVYVYLVQDRLKAAELYSGRLSGMLTPDTIRAINAVCRKGERAENCGLGPMSPVVAGQIADALFKAPEAATSTAN
jgi:TPR repeat protein